MKRKKVKTKNRRILKRKVTLGFLVLSTILLFSSVIAIFEFTRMNKAMSGTIEENVRSVNLARTLMTLSEDYNLEMLNAMSASDSVAAVSFIEPGERFSEEFASGLEELRKAFTTTTEHVRADSVLLAYTAYMQVLRESSDIMSRDFEARRDWYFNRLQPFYLKLRGYIESLTFAGQESLMANSKKVDDTFYRSIMPAFASVAVGLIVIILFNYFLNFYLLTPLEKIKAGIKNYRSYRKQYTVEIKNRDDDLSELNDTVRDLIEDHKSATRDKV